MAKPDEQTPRLPGMPTPALEVQHRTEAMQNAVRDFHSAALGILDNLRNQDGARLTMTYTLRGDKIQIAITPKRED